MVISIEKSINAKSSEAVIGSFRAVLLKSVSELLSPDHLSLANLHGLEIQIIR